MLKIINKELTKMEEHGWDFTDLDYIPLRDVRNKLEKAKAKKLKT